MFVRKFFQVFHWIWILRNTITYTGYEFSLQFPYFFSMQILQMFHRKVHPESSMAARISGKPHRNDIKNKINYSNDDRVLPNEDIRVFPQRTLSKESIQRFKSHSNSPQVTLSGIDSNGNREHWIKTDADCKYTRTLRSQNPLHVPDFLVIIILP